jgi:hypothetical protein
MYVKTRVQLYLICVLSCLIFSTGCQKESSSAAAPPSLVVDTSICLGPASQPGAPITSCRQQISTRSDDTVTTGCFILENATQRTVVPTLWIDDRVETLPGQDSLSLGDSNQLTVSFFGFASSEGAAQCSSVTATSGCSGLSDCLIKLGPQVKQIVQGQVMVFDFVEPPSGCLMETSVELRGQSEACDGYDNDCDGRFDEDATFVGNVCPFDVTETCTRIGTEICQDGSLRCQTEPQEDLCNQVDDDCDGTVDEDQPCPDCNVNSDCPNNLYCEDSNCFECLENSHCPGSQPVCIDNECVPCSENPQCLDGKVCDVSSGRCGACSTSTNEAPCDSGLICDPNSLTCQSCSADGLSCPDGALCINGVCGECDPNDQSNRTCGVGLICADDRTQNLGYRCRPCNPAALQNECPQDRFCVAEPEGERASCKTCSLQATIGDNGCLAATPICETNTSTGELTCVGCNDGSVQGQPQRLCGDGATCNNGRCEGCRPSTAPSPTICPNSTPICASSNGGPYSCVRCGTNAQCNEQFSDHAKDSCQDGECVDCNDEGGCDPESTRPICNSQLCEGCTSDAECLALGLSGGRRYCINSGANVGICERCKPGTNDGCGQQLCSNEFECEPCSSDDNYCPTLFANAPACVDDFCQACDDHAEVGQNHCPTNTPICSGQPLSCGACTNDDDCGSLQCDSGQCLACSNSNYETQSVTGSSLDIAIHSGCSPFAPICNDQSCTACMIDADCPIGECTTFGGGIARDRCRIATEDSCTSRRMKFNANQQTCESCDNEYCNSNSSTPCRATLQTDDFGTTISKCGGCQSDNDCDQRDTPICNEIVGDIVEVIGIPAWVCRACTNDDDCGTNANRAQTYCSTGGTCRICLNTETGGQIDLGCTAAKPRCNENHQQCED